MPDQTVTVVALIRARPGSQQQVKDSLLGLVPPTLKEQGCINYDAHQDLADPCLFVFHENWASEEDLDRHLASDHLTQWFNHAQPLLAQPVVIHRLARIS